MDEVGNNRDKLEFNNLHEDSEELYGKNLTFERYTAVNKQLGSKAWLGLYGLKRNNIDKLSVLQNIGFLVKEGYYHCLGKYVKSCYGDNLFVRVRNDQTGDVYNVTAKRGYIKELKLRVSRAVELYRDRLTWLTSGSRSIFGVLQEHSAIFLIDIKTQSPEIFSRFIKSLEYLVTDQLKKMKLFNMIRCQDEPFVFSNELVAVDDCSLRNVLQWVTELKRLTFFSANCTAECISSINQLTKCFEAIYLITEGESSMISPGILENVVKTLKHPLHIVSYGCENMHSIEYLHSLCTNTGGRFHAYCINMQIPLYSPSCWDVEKFQQMIEVNKIEYGGPPKGWGQHEDCVLIFQELEEARSILQRIEQILHDIDCMPNQGNQDSSLKSCQPAPLTNTCKLDWKREEDMSSKEWLSIHGLKAQHLDFYDLLASVSFKHCDGVVNVLIPPLDNVLDNKNVFTSSSTSNNDIHKVYEKIYDNSMIDHQSEPNLKTSSQIWSSHAIVQPKLINAQYCSNFVHVLWKDNTIVHVQVTPELYRLYYQRMQSRLNAIQQRLNMLRKGSRELFGTITEDDVYILIDTSTSMLSCIEFVKEKLLQLLYDQLKYKNHWNLIAFNSTINAWSNHLQSTTEQNLKSAIKWIEKLNCGGSTNT
ncbi:unnamed protein product [Heterobilharzia americana]|nr:unnamed protein product [Heterobilharzia americana]